MQSFCVDNEDHSKPPSANAREEALALETETRSTLEEKGHGEAHGAICPDQVDLAPVGVKEAGFDGDEIEHRPEREQCLQTRL